MIRERITSRSNPLIVRLRKLNSKRSMRREEGVFCGEGPKLLAEALKWGGELETIVCTADAMLPPLPEHVRVAEVPNDLLSAVADTESPQGIVFTVKTTPLSLPEKLDGKRYLILDGVQDPGNLGTVWRTADAFNADGLILCGNCADPWNPKTVRATMGAAFRLPVYEATLQEVAKRLSASGIPLYATALRDDTVDVREVSLSSAAVIIGSEGRGVSDLALELCSQTLKIPMRERCESLNAAVAASVVLWEMARSELR